MAELLVPALGFVLLSATALAAEPAARHFPEFGCSIEPDLQPYRPNEAELWFGTNRYLSLGGEFYFSRSDLRVDGMRKSLEIRYLGEWQAPKGVETIKDEVEKNPNVDKTAPACFSVYAIEPPTNGVGMRPDEWGLCDSRDKRQADIMLIERYNSLLPTQSELMRVTFLPVGASFDENVLKHDCGPFVYEKTNLPPPPRQPVHP